jgi:uncharacterized protein
LESAVLSNHVLWEETLPGAATWSHILKRGTALRLTDIEGGANVGAIFLNAENFSERFNLPDTLKAQHTAKLTAGHVLYSDMARILCSITHDSLGWHDPIAGHANAAMVLKKYGEASYQQCRNDWHQNAHDGFLIELAKYGLGARDMMANLNFFSKVRVDDNGSLAFISGHSKAGSFVELRAEMNVLVILNTCQHPLDPNSQYSPKPVTLTLKRVPSPAADDLCRLSAPENGRGFTLTERYFL